MSEINQGQELAGESFDDLFQRACNLGVYEGAELSELPEYVRMRLKPILEGYCKDYTYQGKKIVLYVRISEREFPAIPPRETVLFQQDHEILTEMWIEKYFYEEGFKKFDVWSLIGNTSQQVGCFQHLVPFFKERGVCEDVASIGSYDMIECTVMLNQ